MTRGGRFLFLLLLCVAAAVPAGAQRQSLGVFGTWGAFRSQAGCYAVTAPWQGPAPESWRPFVSVAHWPRRRIANQLHVRLSRTKRDGSAVLLRIDGRVYQLSGGRRDAWAPDARADAEIQDAMRTGMEMIVETRSAAGRLIRDHYRLQGAATAMDAAAIACIRR